jgi:TetR/AcrR family transcriptional regulator, fatty acid metabolism regulator protein
MSPRTKAQVAQLRSARKAQILQAANDVFSRKGFHAANVSDVAAEAGISQGTVYHYFDSKEELFMAVFEAWETGSLNREVQAAMDASKSASERLGYLGHAVGEYMALAEETFPASVEFWSHIHRDAFIREGFRRIFAELRATLAQLIQDGIAQGEFVAIDSNAVAALLIAVYDGLILQWLADSQSVDWQTAFATLSELMFYGLLKNPPKRRSQKGS